MIKINSLKTLDMISDIYYINDRLQVINISNGYIKKVSCGHRIYPYVTLETKNKSINKKVQMHKIIALAFIDNNEYEVIEHINNNKQDYSIKNLKFSNQKNNCVNASNDGLIKREEIICELIYQNQKFYGTIKELHKITNIPKGTLYDNLYNERNGNIKISILEGQTTIQ